MPHVDLDVETTLSPDEVRAMLLDFTDRRPEIWPGLSADHYEVREVGETWAVVREGNRSPNIWAVERYDWSVPGTVRWTVVQSNFSTVGSYVQADLKPREGGGTTIHLTWDRRGTGPLGRFLIRLIALTGGKPVAASFRQALKRAEAAKAA